ncbi:MULTISPECIES: hypothetical protein [Providencia]|uniref:hypothetical protein n=1 Tax=Providencia TaxID=586 RepID=UPI00208DD16B|nr:MULTISPECIES: hypothetical protein [Providencia]URQ57278.1 Hypothetical protein [Providencia alcalifaciens]
MNYQVLFSETHKKDATGDAYEVYHFDSINEFFTFLKKTRFTEKMNTRYRYILTDGTTHFDLTYRELVSANHIKPFKNALRQYR